MTRDELASHVDSTIAEARQRFLASSVKYELSPNEQSFERASIGSMLVGLREEILDSINYGVMLDILIQRRIADLTAAGMFDVRPGEDYVAALSRECGVEVG